VRRAGVELEKILQAVDAKSREAEEGGIEELTEADIESLFK